MKMVELVKVKNKKKINKDKEDDYWNRMEHRNSRFIKNSFGY